MTIRLQRSKTLRHFSWFFIAMGIIILVVGAALAWSQLQANQASDNSPLQPVTNGGTEAPPSTEKPKPSEFDSYTVAQDLPRYLFISKLSIKAMVKHVGLAKDNRIDAPKNAFDVGWYTGSAKPGQAGAMLIDGHVAGDGGPGIFHNLHKLRADDVITLERGDGTKLTYHVVTTKEYGVNNVDMQSVLSPVTNKPGLNLITCTGNVMKGTNNYDKRLVVFAEQS